MNAADPIRRVSVVSTSQVQILSGREASNWRPTSPILVTPAHQARRKTWREPVELNRARLQEPTMSSTSNVSSDARNRCSAWCAMRRRNIFMNVRDAFYEILRTHGITTIFGNPGSNELPLLSDMPDDFRYILARRRAPRSGWRTATRRPPAGLRW